MDINWRSTIDEARFGNWCRTTNGENECIVINRKGVGSGTIVEGIQRCFYMDIQRFERDSTRANTTKIKLDTSILPAHEVKYRWNPNYATIVKQDIDRLLVVGFIEYVEKATWLSPIVIVLKKNGKLRIWIDLKKLNVATKKDPYPLPFTD